MKQREKERYITNYLSSNGGKMTREKLGASLIANGVVANETEAYYALQELKNEGYVELTKEDLVILIKTRECNPRMSDIFLNTNSKVKGQVELSPNAMNQNPPMPL